MRRALQLLVFFAAALVAVNAQCIVTCDPAPAAPKSHCHPKQAPTQCSHDLSIVEKAHSTDFALTFAMPIAAIQERREISVNPDRIAVDHPSPPPIVRSSIFILRL